MGRSVKVAKKNKTYILNLNIKINMSIKQKLYIILYFNKICKLSLYVLKCIFSKIRYFSIFKNIITQLWLLFLITIVFVKKAM